VCGGEACAETGVRVGLGSGDVYVMIDYGLEGKG
jgi:hypothetical protein